MIDGLKLRFVEEAHGTLPNQCYLSGMNQPAVHSASETAKPETGALLSFANRAIYYWDYYLLTSKLDYLTAAYQFMSDYRSGGGQAYANTWAAIQATSETLSARA
jgi:hypothetical protein